MKKIHKTRKRCPVTKKAVFTKQEQASRAMMYVISHDPNANMFDLHTYRCEFCKGWHFGHQKWYKPTQIDVTDSVSVGVD